MDVLNNAIETFDGSVSRSDIEKMSYRQLLIEMEHRARFVKENEEYMAAKQAEAELKQKM